MDFRRTIGNRITAPIVPFLRKMGFTPDILTWIGLGINIIAAVLVAMNYLLVGGILTLVSGLFDILDGALARYMKKATKFGALLDSTLDRVSEAVMLFGLLVLYASNANAATVLFGFPVFDANSAVIIMLSLIMAVLIFSFLISYIRARAEGLGIDCQVGFFTRTERVIIMALGLIFNIVFIALIILALFSFITVIQRLVHVYRQTHKVR